MGYTPVFQSIFNGSLYGRWPDTAVWLILLALSDVHGHVDMVPEAISALSGMPLEELLQGLANLEAPDPKSRSRAEDGRRIVRLDPARPWGWRLVNHELYRNKARKAAFDEKRRDSGENAERMRERRHRETPGDTTGPGETRQDPTPPDSTRPHTQTQTQTQTQREEQRSQGSPDDEKRHDVVASRSTPRGTRCPVDDPALIATPDVLAWKRENAPDVELAPALSEFIDYWRGVPGARGRKLDWPATFRNRLRELQGKRRDSRAPRGPVLLPVADG